MSLSDKIQEGLYCITGDIREAVKELKDCFSKPDYYKWRDIVSKIDEIFGERLAK